MTINVLSGNNAIKTHKLPISASCSWKFGVLGSHSLDETGPSSARPIIKPHNVSTATMWETAVELEDLALWLYCSARLQPRKLLTDFILVLIWPQRGYWLGCSDTIIILYPDNLTTHPLEYWAVDHPSLQIQPSVINPLMPLMSDTGGGHRKKTISQVIVWKEKLNCTWSCNLLCSLSTNLSFTVASWGFIVKYFSFSQFSSLTKPYLQLSLPGSVEHRY